MVVLELREQVLEVSAARFDARLESFAERQHSLLYDFQWQTIPDDLQRCFQLGDIPRLGLYLSYLSSIIPHTQKSSGFKSGEFGDHSALSMRSRHCCCSQVCAR